MLFTMSSYSDLISRATAEPRSARPLRALVGVADGSPVLIDLTDGAPLAVDDPDLCPTILQSMIDLNPDAVPEVWAAAPTITAARTFDDAAALAAAVTAEIGARAGGRDTPRVVVYADTRTDSIVVDAAARGRDVGVYLLLAAPATHGASGLAVTGDRVMYLRRSTPVISLLPPPPPA